MRSITLLRPLVALLACVTSGLATEIIKPDPAYAAKVAPLLNGGSNLEGVKGLPLATRALAEAEQLSRETGRPISYQFVLWLGDFQRFAKQWDDARASYDRALALATTNHSADSMEAGWVIYSQAALHHDQGDYRAGVPLYRRALEIAEKHLGPTHDEVASRLQELAYELVQTGDTREVEPLLLRAAAILEKSTGPDAAENLIYVHASLGLFFIQSGQHEKATEPLRLAYEGRKRTRPAGHSSIGATADNLACNYMDRGDYASALPLFEESIAILEKAMGRDAARTALAQTHFAQLLLEMGDYRRALVLAEQALATQRKTSGEASTYAGTSGSTVALILARLGDYERAVPLMEKCRGIIDATFGPRSSYGVSARLNLAGLYIDQARWTDAAPLITDALALAQTVLGDDHPKTNAARLKLARYHEHLHEWPAGRAALLAAETSHRRVLGAQSPFLAEALSDRARFELAAGDFNAARHAATEALAIYEQTAGTAFPAQVDTLDHLATAQLALGDLPAVATTAHRLENARAALLDRVLAFGSEEQRLRALATRDPYRFFAAINQPAALVATALRAKGRVLDSLLRDNRFAQTNTASAATRYQTWLSLRSQHTALLEQAPKGSTAEALVRRQALLGSLEHALRELEPDLPATSTRDADALTPEQLAAALPPETAAVEILRYQRHTGSGNFTPAYGALVITPDQAGRWVLLGDAATLDPQVNSLREALAQGSPTLAAQLRAVAAAVWQPLATAMPATTRTIFLSPDGALNFVSFAILPGHEGNFAGERHAFIYLGAARELLSLGTRATADRRLALFAAPAFAAIKPTNHSASPAATDPADPHAPKTSLRLPALTRAADRQALAALKLPDLPGTAREASAIVTLARAHEFEASLFAGRAADEPTLKTIASPRVLHLATHGFFLDPEAGRSGLPANPMQRAGLALAGAQSALTAWRTGTSLPEENDGILTAAEASLLDLRHTELVTLSACDTGLGEAHTGEGVLGLRRGFALAGARHVLMTLWPVADASTAEFMEKFYATYLASGDPTTAFHDTQRTWLAHQRTRVGLGAAARTGGAFLLSGVR